MDARTRASPKKERVKSSRWAVVSTHGRLAQGEEEAPLDELLGDELGAEAHVGVHAGEDGEQVVEVAVEDHVEVFEGADRQPVGEAHQAELEARDRDQVGGSGGTHRGRDRGTAATLLRGWTARPTCRGQDEKRRGGRHRRRPGRRGRTRRRPGRRGRPGRRRRRAGGAHAAAPAALLHQLQGVQHALPREVDLGHFAALQSGVGATRQSVPVVVQLVVAALPGGRGGGCGGGRPRRRPSRRRRRRHWGRPRGSGGRGDVRKRRRRRNGRGHGLHDVRQRCLKFF